MARHNELGKHGEDTIQEYLIEKGYSIVYRNWKCREGEIDLIVSNNDQLIFVEVKTRATNYWGNPEQAISEAKIKRIVNAANSYIQEYDVELDIRFDIASVVIRNGQTEIYYIKDAFMAPLN